MYAVWNLESSFSQQKKNSTSMSIWAMCGWCGCIQRSIMNEVLIGMMEFIEWNKKDETTIQWVAYVKEGIMDGYNEKSTNEIRMN